MAPDLTLLPPADHAHQRSHQLIAPRGRTSHDQRIRVPSYTGSNVNAPSVSLIDERVTEASRAGRS